MGHCKWTTDLRCFTITRFMCYICSLACFWSTGAGIEVLFLPLVTCSWSCGAIVNATSVNHASPTMFRDHQYRWLSLLWFWRLSLVQLGSGLGVLTDRVVTWSHNVSLTPRPHLTAGCTVCRLRGETTASVKWNMVPMWFFSILHSSTPGDLCLNQPYLIVVY